MVANEQLLLKLPIRILNRNPYEYSVFTSKK